MEQKEINPIKKALRFQNTFRAFSEDVENALGELITEFGTPSATDPNVYNIDIPEPFHCATEDYWLGGTISLDVAYYNGIILYQAYDTSKMETKIGEYDFESLDLMSKIYLYKIMANHYAKQ